MKTFKDLERCSIQYVALLRHIHGVWHGHPDFLVSPGVIVNICRSCKRKVLVHRHACKSLTEPEEMGISMLQNAYQKL
jgi:hypothetical protein